MRAAVPFILYILILMLGLESATGAKSKITLPRLKISVPAAPTPRTTTQRPTPSPKITIKPSERSQTIRNANGTQDCFEFEKPPPWTWVESFANGSVTFRCEALERLCATDWPAKHVTVNVTHLFKTADECRIGVLLNQDKSKPVMDADSLFRSNSTEVLNGTITA